MGKSRIRSLAAAALGLALVTWAGASGDAPSGASQYAFDPVHSSATFRVEHAGTSWVSGRFNDVSGKCAIDRDDAGKCAFELTIKTSSIDTNNAVRDADLRSANFFDANRFPEMTFKSTSVKKAAAPAPAPGSPATGPAVGPVYEVTGDFTMHGVTKPVTVLLRGGKETEFPKGTQRIGFFADFSLKRSDFGMDKDPGSVGDEVKIAVSFEAVKQ
jgi:polyisoprenoid-binding protein YceI